MPPSFKTQYGPWAVVAGASEGLGAAFASALAARGINLVLIARRAELLESVAKDLRAKHAVEIRTAVCDLARPDLAQALETLTTGLDVGLVVYNAAYAPVGEFLQRPLDDLLCVVDVNVRAPLIVARTLAPAMVARGRGGIVLMASLAGFQGVPRIAAYAASKAFAIVLGESLWRELAPRGVDVVVSCAGAIRTPGYEKSTARDAPGLLEPAALVEETLAALSHGPALVPGAFNRFARFVMGRVLPRRAAIAIMARSTKDLS